MPTSSTSVFRSLAARPTFLRGTDDVPPFAPAFRTANAELAPFRGTLWDLEPALLDVMADYPRLQASGLPVDTFLAQRKEPRRPESDFLLRTVAQPGGAPQIGSLLRRYGESAKLTFPDITPADLLQRVSDAMNEEASKAKAADSIRPADFEKPISMESLMPYSTSVFRGLRKQREPFTTSTPVTPIDENRGDGMIPWSRPKQPEEVEYPRLAPGTATPSNHDRLPLKPLAYARRQHPAK